MTTALSAHPVPPAPQPTLPLNGGNVYFVDNQCARNADDNCNCETCREIERDILTVGGAFAITVLVMMAAAFIIVGYGWAHLEAFLWASVK